MVEQNHPLWGNSAVLIVVLDPKELSRHKEEIKGMGIPQSSSEGDLLSQGWLKLPSGVPIFSRHVSSKDHADDIFEGFFTDGKSVRQKFREDVDALDDVQEKILGPRVNRNGSIKGGIAFEKEEYRNQDNIQGARCYSLGLTVEVARGVSHPSSNMHESQTSKFADQEALQTRRRLNAVSTSSPLFLINCRD